MINIETRWIEIIGIIAGFLTTISFLPEVIKIYKNSNINGISESFLYIYLLGVFFWIFYGIMIRSISVIVFSLFNFILVILILGRYYYLRNKTKSS
tara:strand:- start:437 stop:724 length:288 start_codon:yes stop_codon:yes gene_type:complete